MRGDPITVWLTRNGKPWSAVQVGRLVKRHAEGV